MHWFSSSTSSTRPPDGNVVRAAYEPVPDDAKNAWAHVWLGTVAEQAGTVEFTVVGQKLQQAVYADALALRTRTSLIVQEQHLTPYGAPLTGLSYLVGGRRYRHGYQGQYAENDTLTGWQSFELRLYDARIGRWLSTDPYGQFASPYVGMGNNPVSGVDPDGGWVSGQLLAMGAGFVVGAAVGGYVARQEGKSALAGAIIGGTLGAVVGGSLYPGSTIQNLASDAATTFVEKLPVIRVGNGWSAFTVPNVAIFAGGQFMADERNAGNLKHEYGHQLWADRFGAFNFWTAVAPRSFASNYSSAVDYKKSQKKNDHEYTFMHNYTWTETSANYLARKHFGFDALKAKVYPNPSTIIPSLSPRVKTKIPHRFSVEAE